MSRLILFGLLLVPGGAMGSEKSIQQQELERAALKRSALVIRATATPTSKHDLGGFAWRLTRPDGKEVVLGKGSTACYPGKEIVFTVPRPESGTWTLSLCREEENPSDKERITGSEWDRYFQAMMRYLVLRQGLTLDELRKFAEDIHRLDPKKIGRPEVGSHNARVHAELERYATYRLLVWQAELARRVDSKGRPLAEFQAVAKRLGDLLKTLATEAKRAKPGSDEAWPEQRLHLALVAEEEARAVRAAGGKKEWLEIRSKPGWDALDAELRELRSVKNLAGQDYRSNTAYMVARSAWARQRAAWEQRVWPGERKNHERALLQEALEVGKRDPFLQFILREYHLLTSREATWDLHLRADRGPLSWPSKTTTDRQRVTLRTPVGESAVPVLRVRVGAGEMVVTQP